MSGSLMPATARIDVVADKRGFILNILDSVPSNFA
jgi:hypothetical protein